MHDHDIQDFYVTPGAAMKHALRHCGSKGHKYIINARGPVEQKTGWATTVQIVPERMVFGTGGLGLTVYLPFDETRAARKHAKFLAAGHDQVCRRCDWDGIPIYAQHFGTDTVSATAFLQSVLADVYDYPGFDGFHFLVRDQGPAAGD